MESQNNPETSLLNDEELVRCILNGETHLYAHLMRKFNLRLYRISMSIIKDDSAVEDVMQTTYLNAYLQLNNFQNRSSFGTWITRILINESLLFLKKQARQREFVSQKQENHHHSDTPLTKLMNNELKLILEKSVSGLPEKYRLVFVMREVEEMSTKETMEILNISESNVKIRLKRAKEILQQELSHFYEPKQLFEFNLVRCDRIVNYVLSEIEKRRRSTDYTN
nr:sigma-70 family RNA polymerase sigma factor [uncultured Fluviicola sp.]